jgi:hypothetical protein
MTAAAGHIANCLPFNGVSPHQGGDAHDPGSTARGVSGVITVRTSDLCDNPIQPFDSATTAYVMLNNLGDGVPDWYQVGYRRTQLRSTAL